MASIRTLFEQIMELEPEQVLEVNGVSSVREFENLRIPLVKMWSEKRLIIRAINDDDTDAELSLCATFVPESHCASFFIGKARRPEPKQFDFVIKSKQANSGAT